MNKSFNLYSLLIISIFCLCACNTYKNLPYFQNIPPDSTRLLVKTAEFKDPIILKNDLLYVTIQTLDNNINTLVNAANATGAQAGYLVDKNGEILLPFIGTFKVEGLTTTQAQLLITAEANKHFNSPVITVRYANFKVTILGEVARPGTFISPTEKINVLDAIGLAGDLTPYAKRDDIFLIRDSLQNQIFVKMDLRNTNIISSNYFYLQPNDILYIKPAKTVVAKDAAITNRSNFQIIASIVSLALVLITFTRKN